MVEVVGFLSTDPILSHPSYHNGEDDNEMEIQTHNPPPSLVPRIHCVDFRKITDCNPLVNVYDLSTEMETLRKDLHLVLTQLLLGDELAADYLICHLISSV